MISPFLPALRLTTLLVLEHSRKRTRVYQFSHSVMSDFLWPPWAAARQASLSTTNSQSLLKLMSIESVMPSNHLILCVPFSSCLEAFPTSGSFPMSRFFTSGGQSIGVSASTSVLPMNIQDWFPLGWTCWIFSNTTVYIDPVIQYILILCIKYITNENLLYSTGNST